METKYYTDYTDDFVQSKNQTAKVPEDYPWVPNRFLSALVYAAAITVGIFYLPLGLHIRYENRRVLKSGPGFLYCNHTQPFGDVLIPAMPCLPGRIYTVVSPANLGIPVIGKILPYLGAIPIPDSLAGMKKFTKTMEKRLGENRFITIFPEAHVWEYCGFVRPYPVTSFKYPVKYGKPSYALTVTYQKRRCFKKPKAVVYIDGPFWPDESLPPKDRAADLHRKIYTTMKQRTQNTNCHYIRYEQR